MDYEYYDESRTRFQLQSGPSANSEEDKKTVHLLEVGSCFSVALLLLCFAWFSHGFLQFLLLWISSSLFAGPFAPVSATGGPCRVGVGELLPAEIEPETVETEIASVRNSKQRKKVSISHSEEPLPLETRRDESAKDNNALQQKGDHGKFANGGGDDGDEEEDVDDSDDEEHDDNDDDVYDYDRHTHHKGDLCNGSSTQSDDGHGIAARSEAEWTSADIDQLKKLMVRYPKGMLRRWEVIAESFDGSHSVESIVKMSKSMGERKKGSNDSYSDFLAKRKVSANAITSPLSQRWDMNESSAIENSVPDEEVAIMEGDDGLTKAATAIPHKEAKRKKEWTETEDKALLNALKTFPKDTPMRWEKVAIAVPSRTKQQCFRRFAQLKEGFRSNKQEKD